jgi:large subunit ribosomal protein L25
MTPGMASGYTAREKIDETSAISVFDKSNHPFRVAAPVPALHISIWGEGGAGTFCPSAPVRAHFCERHGPKSYRIELTYIIHTHMSKAHALTAHTRKRSGSGALTSLRAEGLIPAVVYGKGHPGANVRLNRKEVETVLHSAASENILVNLTIEDTKETRLALIQDVQHNPLTGKIIHMDFHAINENEVIHASIPLDLVGDAAGVKAGGLLEHLIHKLEVRCLPKDLPETIKVDVTDLAMGAHMMVKDIKMPSGVKAGIDGEIMIAMVSEPRTAAEPAASTPASDAKAAAPAKGAKPAAAAAAPAAKKK